MAEEEQANIPIGSPNTKFTMSQFLRFSELASEYLHRREVANGKDPLLDLYQRPDALDTEQGTQRQPSLIDDMTNAAIVAGMDATLKERQQMARRLLTLRKQAADRGQTARRKSFS